MNIEEHSRFMLEFLTESRKARFEEVLSQRTRSAVAVLEDTAKEQNASAVLRTLDALGFHEVHMVEKNWKVKLKSEISKNSDKWLDLRKSESMVDTLRSLKSRGYHIAVTSPHEQGKTHRELPTDKPLAVVFGNEFNGISEEAVEIADDYLQIPMYGFVESYNLSVSVGMVFSALRWQMEEAKTIAYLSEDEKHLIRLRWAIRSARSGAKVYEKWVRENGDVDLSGILPELELHNCGK